MNFLCNTKTLSRVRIRTGLVIFIIWLLMVEVEVGVVVVLNNLLNLMGLIERSVTVLYIFISGVTRIVLGLWKSSKK